MVSVVSAQVSVSVLCGQCPRGFQCPGDQCLVVSALRSVLGGQCSVISALCALWSVLRSQSSVLCAQISVVSALCSGLSGQCSVVSTLCSVLSSQCSVLSGQCTVLSGGQCSVSDLLVSVGAVELQISRISQKNNPADAATTGLQRGDGHRDRTIGNGSSDHRPAEIRLEVLQLLRVKWSGVSWVRTWNQTQSCVGYSVWCVFLKQVHSSCPQLLSCLISCFPSLFPVLLHNAIPFIGFGFLDNAIMIAAGTQIEMSIGVILGISTMAAAALGNLVSDLAGLGLAGYVEALACRLGMQIPDLSPKQADMWQTRVSAHMGKAIGVGIGCILGMFPLFFYKDDEEKTEDGAENPSPLPPPPPNPDSASKSA
ncbi:hypothetical protein QTP86_008929 [Hemibagrus guttatus]|nr:hypothetical protein QTP86_008929 [Hemibagrus guttatus]